MSDSERHRVGGWVLNTVLVVGGLVMLAPFIWLVTASVQPATKAFSLPPHWIPTDIGLENYRGVFDTIPFGVQILNSLGVTAAIVIGSLVVACLAAYPLARLEFRGRDTIFIMFLAALMIPAQVTVIPVYLLLRYLHLIDTRTALVLPALIQVLGIFLLRQHFRTVPRELTEAAMLDGASHWRILRTIVVPAAGPALSALAIFTAQQYWNDFFWPNVLLSTPSKLTLPLGVYSLQNLHGTGSPVVIFAAISMIVVPLLVMFAFTQRRLTEGMVLVGANR